MQCVDKDPVSCVMFVAVPLLAWLSDSAALSSSAFYQLQALNGCAGSKPWLLKASTCYTPLFSGHACPLRERETVYKDDSMKRGTFRVTCVCSMPRLLH